MFTDQNRYHVIKGVKFTFINLIKSGQMKNTVSKVWTVCYFAGREESYFIAMLRGGGGGGWWFFKIFVVLCVFR